MTPGEEWISVTSLLRRREKERPKQAASGPRSPVVTGMLTGISLPATLQMLNFEKRHCTVKVDAPEGSGEITLIDGEIVNATTKDISGVSAATEILSWPEVNVEIQNARELTSREIFQPLHQLLMDAYRLRDEHAGQAPNPASTPSPSILSPERIDDVRGTKSSGGTNRDYGRLLSQVGQLSGVFSATIFDFENGLFASCEPGQSGASVSHFWEATALHVDQLALLNAVTSQPGAQDGLLVYATQYHVFRPVTPNGQVFLYFILDRTRANLVEARQVAQRMKLD